jgi:hypothetical protein
MPPPTAAGFDRARETDRARVGRPSRPEAARPPTRSDGRTIAVHPESAAAAGAVGSFVRHREHRKIRPNGSSTSRETCPQDAFGHRAVVGINSPPFLLATRLAGPLAARAATGTHPRLPPGPPYTAARLDPDPVRPIGPARPPQTMTRRPIPGYL